MPTSAGMLPDEIESVDQARDQKCADSYNAEGREAKRRGPRDRERRGIASRRPEHQRQGNERTDPRRCGGEVQKIGSRMDDGLGPGAAHGVAPPCQNSHETGGRRHRRDVDEPDRPRRFVARRQRHGEYDGEQAREDCSHQPGAPKICLQQDDPEETFGKDLRRRAFAHRCGDENEPHGPRRERQYKADPRQPSERRLNRGRQARIAIDVPKCRFGDEHDKEERHPPP